jgi:hypothetical protein
MRMQRVSWVDSCTETGWSSLEKKDLTLAKCTTIGLRVKSAKNVVALAQSRSDAGSFSEVMIIPRSCVRKIERLEVR